MISAVPDYEWLKVRIILDDGTTDLISLEQAHLLKGQLSRAICLALTNGENDGGWPNLTLEKWEEYNGKRIE